MPGNFLGLDLQISVRFSSPTRSSEPSRRLEASISIISIYGKHCCKREAIEFQRNDILSFFTELMSELYLKRANKYSERERKSKVEKKIISRIQNGMHNGLAI